MVYPAHRNCAPCKTGFTTSTEAKYNYALRRQALRESWFPNSQDGLDECVLLLVLHQHCTRCCTVWLLTRLSYLDVNLGIAWHVLFLYLDCIAGLRRITAS